MTDYMQLMMARLLYQQQQAQLANQANAGSLGQLPQSPPPTPSAMDAGAASDAAASDSGLASLGTGAYSGGGGATVGQLAGPDMQKMGIASAIQGIGSSISNYLSHPALVQMAPPPPMPQMPTFSSPQV